MKKSSQVPATLIVTLAAGVVTSGCGSQATYECRDAYGRMLPYASCQGTMVRGAHIVQTGGFGGSGSGGFFGG